MSAVRTKAFLERVAREFLVGFRVHNPGARWRGTVEDGRLAVQLVEALAAARVAHPGLAVDDGVFAEHLGRSVGRHTPDLARAPEDVRVPDLYLACACLTRVQGAAEVLERRFRPAIARYLERLGMAADAIGEVTQALFAHVLVGEPGRRPALWGYEGRGELAQWIGISAQRLALKTDRADRRRLDLAVRMAEEPTSFHRGPEHSLLIHRHRAALEAAIKEALRSLDSHERMLLRLRVAGRASQRRIARIYRVDPATVSRHLARAQQRVWDQVRERLTRELNVSTRELDSVLRAFESQLEVSLSSALAESGADPTDR